MTKGFSIRKDNYLYLESAAASANVSPSEYLNILIQRDHEEKPLDSTPIQKSPSPKLYKSKKEVNPANPYLCIHCGHIKAAGKCVNKHCGGVRKK